MNHPPNPRQLAPEPPELLSLRAVRAIFLRSRCWINEFGVPTAPSEATIRRWADSDVLPGIPIGGKKFVSKSVVLTFLVNLSKQHRQICG